MGIRADFWCDSLSVSSGTDRTSTELCDAVEISYRLVELLLCHLGVYRVSMGIPGDFHEIGHNC